MGQTIAFCRLPLCGMVSTMATKKIQVEETHHEAKRWSDMLQDALRQTGGPLTQKERE
jgi:hypothetical protein